MKFVVGFLAGSMVAAGAFMMIDPADMKKMRKKCRCAKRMIKGVM